VKILVVSPYPILPALHGSRVRTARLAAAMARANAQVALLCPWYPGQPRNGRIANAFTCRSHFRISNLLPITLPWLAAPLALLSFQPLSRRQARGLEEFDVVQFDFCAHARWMDLVPRHAKIVYSAHNVERDFCAGDAGSYLLSELSLRRIEHLESLAVARSDLVVACTDADVKRLETLYGAIARAIVVPNGCDRSLLDLDWPRLRASARAALGVAEGDRALLFIGGPAAHNREAVEFLLEGLLPQLDRRSRLLIVGQCSRGASVVANGRARLFGYVDDLRPFLAAADVALNPVDRGSGSSVKLLDYLAAGVPVVSTRVGVRGFGAPPAGVQVAERPEFADALRLPLDVTPDRGALDALTWDHLGGALVREYERIRA